MTWLKALQHIRLHQYHDATVLLYEHTDTKSRSLLASIFEATHDYRAATAVISKIIKDDGPHPSWLFYRATLHIYQDLPSLAENDLDRYFLSKIPHPEHRELAHLLRGFARLCLGDYAGALEDVGPVSSSLTLYINEMISKAMITKRARAALNRGSEKFE